MVINVSMNIKIKLTFDLPRRSKNPAGVKGHTGPATVLCKTANRIIMHKFYHLVSQIIGRFGFPRYTTLVFSRYIAFVVYLDVQYV